MQLSINNPEFHTTIIIFFLLIANVIFIKKRKNQSLFPTDITQELKGFAILTIIFGHIGYFLDSNDKFLYPLSIASGVGVNIFLFLSGYGLIKSSIKKPLSMIQFYKKRLPTLFIPMWIVLMLFLTIDWLYLGKTYPIKETIENFFGFFPVADIYTSVNSVLWYFSFILFYYLVFPFFTYKKLLLISPILFYISSYVLLKQDLPINKDVINLYKLHILAFPFGVASALIPTYLLTLPKVKPVYYKILNALKNHPLIVNILLLLPLLYVFTYTSVNSKVGEDKMMEQVISNVTMFSIIFFFILKRFRLSFLTLLGIYSYELYLLHWPIVYRYDFLYQLLPASLATILYLLILFGLAYLLQWITEKILKVLNH